MFLRVFCGACFSQEVHERKFYKVHQARRQRIFRLWGWLRGFGDCCTAGVPVVVGVQAGAVRLAAAALSAAKSPEADGSTGGYNMFADSRLQLVGGGSEVLAHNLHKVA